MSKLWLSMQYLVILCLLTTFIMASEDDNKKDRADDNRPIIKVKRDGYGGYGGGGYGGGCSCPYNSCGHKEHDLVAFGIGALVGLLLALLRALYELSAMPRRSFSTDSVRPDYLGVLQSITEDTTLFSSDLAMIYANSERYPECTRKLVCEITRRAADKGGVRDKLATLSSMVYGWYSQDDVPIIVNLLHKTTLDCEKLGPENCDASFLST